MEAHGGYTFCGYAALVLLERETCCDLKKLLVRYTTRISGNRLGRVSSFDGAWLSSMFRGARRLENL